MTVFGDGIVKILMINKFFFIKGGAERYYFELKSILESRGHEVIPFSMKHPKNEASKYAEFFMEYIDFNPRSFFSKISTGFRSIGRILYSWQAQKRIKRLIQETQPDIAHLHMIDHQISPSILPVLHRAKIPVIQTVHTYKHVCPSYRLYHMTRGEICEKCLDGAYYRALTERCHRGSFLSTLLLVIEMTLHRRLKLYEKFIDLFIPPSHFMGRMLVRGGFDPSKIRQLFYTIQIDSFPHGLQEDDYFVFYGRLSEEKGLLTLLEAMQGVDNGYLKIIGEGPMKAELDRTIQKSEIGDRVILTGAMGGEELKQAVARSQFVVVPSEWYENSPLVIYESFAMGKPVIGADIGGISELVEDGIHGLLFRAGDSEVLRAAIKKLLSDSTLRKQMGSAARQRAEALFDPEVHYQEMIGIMRHEISKKRDNDQ
jgi:glycosyltransferase involved in cell wall biosynthesis